VLRSDRAVEEPPAQPSRRGREPYNRRRGSNPGSRVAGGTRQHRPENEILVDVIFSAHSDGLMAILRKA